MKETVPKGATAQDALFLAAEKEGIDIRPSDKKMSFSFFDEPESVPTLESKPLNVDDSTAVIEDTDVDPSALRDNIDLSRVMLISNVVQLASHFHRDRYSSISLTNYNMLILRLCLGDCLTLT